MRGGSGRALDDLKFLQEKPETGHDEAESHQRPPRSNPREKSSFGREIIADVGALFRIRRDSHSSALRIRIDSLRFYCMTLQKSQQTIRSGPADEPLVSGCDGDSNSTKAGCGLAAACFMPRFA